MGRLEDALLAHPLYAQAEARARAGAGEALERYLVKRLRAVLAARDAAQGARDAALAARLERLAAFLEPRHLDIAPSRVHPDAWAQVPRPARPARRPVHRPGPLAAAVTERVRLPPQRRVRLVQKEGRDVSS
jgi:hypothetical protein